VIYSLLRSFQCKVTISGLPPFRISLKRRENSH